MCKLQPENGRAEFLPSPGFYTKKNLQILFQLVWDPAVFSWPSSRTELLGQNCRMRGLKACWVTDHIAWGFSGIINYEGDESVTYSSFPIWPQSATKHRVTSHCYYLPFHSLVSILCSCFLLKGNWDGRPSRNKYSFVALRNRTGSHSVKGFVLGPRLHYKSERAVALWTNTNCHLEVEKHDRRQFSPKGTL